MQISFWYPVFILLVYIPQSGSARSYGSSIFNFWGTCIQSSIVAELIYIPSNSVQGFPFLLIFANTYYLFFFLMITILAGVGLYLIMVLIFLSLMVSDVEKILICLWAICISFCKNFYLVPLSILYLSCLLMLSSSLRDVSSLYLLDINLFSSMWVAYIFSIPYVAFILLIGPFAVQKTFCLM